MQEIIDILCQGEKVYAIDFDTLVPCNEETFFSEDKTFSILDDNSEKFITPEQIINDVY